MYFISDVYPIHIFPSTILAPKTLSQSLVISCHCVALVPRFELDAFVYLPEYHYYLKKTESFTLEDVLHQVDFQSRHVIY